MSIVFDWNGEKIPDDVRERKPAELRSLPRRRYVLERVDDVPELTDEEDSGIHAAIESVCAGKGVSVEAAKPRIGRILSR